MWEKNKVHSDISIELIDNKTMKINVTYIDSTLLKSSTNEQFAIEKINTVNSSQFIDLCSVQVNVLSCFSIYMN